MSFFIRKIYWVASVKVSETRGTNIQNEQDGKKTNNLTYCKDSVYTNHREMEKKITLKCKTWVEKSDKAQIAKRVSKNLQHFRTP